VNIESELIGYFKEKYDVEVDTTTKLIDEGVVDSMGVMELVTFLEQSFDVEFEMDDLTEDNFASIVSVNKLISGKKEEL
jgi:acyl carrier protein